MDTWNIFNKQTPLHYQFYDVRFADKSEMICVSTKALIEWADRITHIRRTALSAVEVERHRCDQIVCEEWTNYTSVETMVSRILNRIRNVGE